MPASRLMADKAASGRGGREKELEDELERGIEDLRQVHYRCNMR